MDINNIDHVADLLKEVTLNLSDSDSGFRENTFVDQLRLFRRVVVELHPYKDRIIEKPSDLVAYDGVTLFGGKKILAGFGDDKGAQAIEIMRTRLKRAPSIAELFEYMLDDAIELFSDPKVQQLLAKAEAARLASKQEA